MIGWYTEYLLVCLELSRTLCHISDYKNVGGLRYLIPELPLKTMLWSSSPIPSLRYRGFNGIRERPRKVVLSLWVTTPGYGMALLLHDVINDYQPCWNKCKSFLRSKCKMMYMILHCVYSRKVKVYNNHWISLITVIKAAINIFLKHISSLKC